MLYTYIMTNDSGCAPNPNYGLCTLALCKPVIRKCAKIGDIIIGFGSKNINNNKIIYIMEVTNKFTFEEYNNYCKVNMPKKIKFGDCIYYQRNKLYMQRKNIFHNKECFKNDISSPYVLVSNNFLYFGCNSVQIKNYFKNLIPKGRAFQSLKNNKYELNFKKYFLELKKKYKSIAGKPINKINKC